MQTRWVLMASRVSKFDSKEAVPGAQDTTRLRKFFRTDSRGKLQLGPARTVRAPRSRGSLNFSRFISLRLMLSSRKGKTYSLELLAVDSRRNPRSRGKSFLRSTDANSTGSLLTIIQEFQELVDGVKQKIFYCISSM